MRKQNEQSYKNGSDSHYFFYLLSLKIYDIGFVDIDKPWE